MANDINKQPSEQSLNDYAECASAEDKYTLGMMYRDGEGVPQNEDKAIYWLKRAADDGFGPAQNEMGIYYDQHGDMRNSIRYLQLASEQDVYGATFGLGMDYSIGGCLCQNPKRAHELKKVGAENDIPFAQYTMHLDYEEGRGVEADWDKALFWLKKAYENNEKHALCKMGDIHDYGGRIDKAIECYRRAADLGNEEAEEKLSNLLLRTHQEKPASESIPAHDASQPSADKINAEPLQPQTAPASSEGSGNQVVPTKKKRNLFGFIFGTIICVMLLFGIKVVCEGRQAKQNVLSASESVVTSSVVETISEAAPSQEVEEYASSLTTSAEGEDNAAAPIEAVPEHRQELRVVSSGSTAVMTLNTWVDGEWIEEMSTTAYIGSNGVSENKREGDRCTPAGTYELSFCFGLSKPQTGLSFVEITQGDVWVCDSNSAYYNTLQSDSASYKDWTSTEDLYKKFANNRSNYCIYFNFNGDGLNTGAVKDCGADLFVDGVGTNGKLTSGYGDVKITADAMVTLLKYLDASLSPVIIIE